MEVSHIEVASAHLVFIMYLTSLYLLLASSSASATVLSARQSAYNSTNTEAYLRKVCYPEVSSGPIPPCQSTINIETACAPNGTDPLAINAHAQCMCTGSFFADWEGCLACASAHGARSPRIVTAFWQIITSASNILCTGTPTAPFAAIFTGLTANSGVEEGGSGDEVASDRFPDQTAVSLYYTQDVSQGPGSITESATAATATASTREKAVTTSSGTRSVAVTSASSSSGRTVATAVTTGSSSSGVEPTGVWMGGLGAVAGGLMLAAM